MAKSYKTSLILTIASIAIAFNAHADDGAHDEPVVTQNPLIGTTSNPSPIRNVPTAIAPSVNNSQICPMVMQGSKAGSVFFFSASGTHNPDIVALCVAWHLDQLDVVERITCEASPAYRRANPNCK